MFEPVHGSARQIAGQGIADPTATISSMALLLDHLGRGADAARIEAAVDADAIERGTTRRSTAQVAAAIAARLSTHTAPDHPGWVRSPRTVLELPAGPRAAGGFGAARHPTTTRDDLSRPASRCFRRCVGRRSRGDYPLPTVRGAHEPLRRRADQGQQGDGGDDHERGENGATLPAMLQDEPAGAPWTPWWRPGTYRKSRRTRRRCRATRRSAMSRAWRPMSTTGP